MSRPEIRIRRLRLVLPARLRATAAADARRIAEAVAQAVHQSGRQASAGRTGAVELPAIHLQGAGRPAAVLANEAAARVGAAMRKGD